MITHEIIKMSMRGLGWVTLIWLVPFAFFDAGRCAENKHDSGTPFAIGLLAYVVLLLCLIGSVRP
jgi:hypothetical protein